MPFDLTTLQTALTSSEAELDHAKAYVSRCDGAIQVLKHLIALHEEGDEVPAKVDD